MSAEKKLLVLARRDHAEAMRVAAGLTIFGHAVSLVFMDRPVAENAENAANAELLELNRHRHSRLPHRGEPNGGDAPQRYRDRPESHARQADRPPVGRASGAQPGAAGLRL